MNQKFINNLLVSSILASGLLVSATQATAEGFHHGKNRNGIAVSSTKFYEVLAKTDTDHLGYNFGAPDEIQTLRNTAGKRIGTIWVYHDAVKKENVMQDANFVVIDGELKYATLSDAS